MRVAGIGCRRFCPAADIVALVQAAAPVDALAAPAWKRHEHGLLEAARLLDLPLLFVDEAILAANQPNCPTHSEAVRRTIGLASVAEAAALAHGVRLIKPRTVLGMATCAIAEGPP